MTVEGAEGLFHEPTRVALAVGDTATLLTLWGQEPCEVLQLTTDKSGNGFPMVVVRTRNGDVVTVNRSSLQETP